jgi:hypothetical protein
LKNYFSKELTILKKFLYSATKINFDYYFIEGGVTGLGDVISDDAHYLADAMKFLANDQRLLIGVKLPNIYVMSTPK